LFEKRHLLEGEIPKIFTYTRFTIDSIYGNLDKDPLGVPLIHKDAQGNTVDQDKRRVNLKGYLIDQEGHIIDKRGYVIFRKQLIEPNGDISKVYRTGLLRSDSESSLSRLMSEIEG
jgi:hypothetical protein